MEIDVLKIFKIDIHCEDNEILECMCASYEILFYVASNAMKIIGFSEIVLGHRTDGVDFKLKDF